MNFMVEFCFDDSSMDKNDLSKKKNENETFSSHEIAICLTTCHWSNQFVQLKTKTIRFISIDVQLAMKMSTLSKFIRYFIELLCVYTANCRSWNLNKDWIQQLKFTFFPFDLRSAAIMDCTFGLIIFAHIHTDIVFKAQSESPTNLHSWLLNVKYELREPIHRLSNYALRVSLGALHAMRLFDIIDLNEREREEWMEFIGTICECVHWTIELDYAGKAVNWV